MSLDLHRWVGLGWTWLSELSCMPSDRKETCLGIRLFKFSLGQIVSGQPIVFSDHLDRIRSVPVYMEWEKSGHWWELCWGKKGDWMERQKKILPKLATGHHSPWEPRLLMANSFCIRMKVQTVSFKRQNACMLDSASFNVSSLNFLFLMYNREIIVVSTF